jgi:acyl-coenzyme A thioesterase PaaI-like protein
MSESWKIKRLRWRFNWYPPFRRTGARVTFISEDLLEARVRLPLDWRTRNPHGSIFGGALYAAVDPIHAVIIGRKLGPGYVVWMKAATIRFKRPARTAVTAEVRLTAAEIDAIRKELHNQRKTDRDFSLSLVDENGEVAANFTLTIHVQRSGQSAPDDGETLQPEF